MVGRAVKALRSCRRTRRPSYFMHTAAAPRGIDRKRGPAHTAWAGPRFSFWTSTNGNRRHRTTTPASAHERVAWTDPVQHPPLEGGITCVPITTGERVVRRVPEAQPAAASPTSPPPPRNPPSPPSSSAGRSPSGAEPGAGARSFPCPCPLPRVTPTRPPSLVQVADDSSAGRYFAAGVAATMRPGL